MQQEEKQKLVRSLVRELVENEGVIAILGPLARNTSLAAERLRNCIRYLSYPFLKTEDIGKDLEYLFRFQRNQIHEAKILAEYAMDYLHAERFVLFYTADRKGYKVMKAFGDEVRRKGGSIVGVARILRNQADFNNSFKGITGGFRSFSKEEEEELKRYSRGRPDSIIDFDAMFLPVRWNTLKIVIDFSKLFDADNVWILAGSEINVRENQLLTSTKRLRFVGNFPLPAQKQFYNHFLRIIGNILIFDPIILLRRIIQCMHMRR